MENLKVAILCGGEGTRLREETEFKPKPMVTIGGMPILWHIMKSYSHYGFKDFILCLGYRGDMIKQYFLTQELMHNDFTINLRDRKKDLVHRRGDGDDWTITFAETGLNTMTGARVKRIEKYVGNDEFLLTYGDAVCDLDISKVLAFHRKQKTLATLTGVHPHTQWGMIKEDGNNVLLEFREKPTLYGYVNGGFYCFRKELFDYLSENEDCVLERDPFEKLVRERQFSMFKHDGFWHAMDTYRDYLDLNRMWDEGRHKWKVWK